MEVRELVTKWGFQVDDRKLTSMENKLSKIKSVIAGFVSVYAAKMLANMVKQTTEYVDQIAKQSEALSITTDKFQELNYAFQINGASMQDFMTSFRKMATSVSQAQHGLETYTRIFDDLGLTMDEVNKASGNTEELFLLIVDQIKKVENPVKKAQLAVDLLGRGGLKMLPAINKGSGAIKELMQRSRDLGFVISSEGIKKGVDLKDTWTDMTMRFTILKAQISLGLIPVFKFLFNSVVPAAISVGKSLWNIIDSLATAFGGWKNILTAIGVYLAYINAPFLILLGLLLAIDDIIGALQGKDSVFTDLFGKEHVEELRNFLNWLEKIRQILIDITAWVIEQLVEGFKGWYELFSKIISLPSKLFKKGEQGISKISETPATSPISNNQTSNTNKQTITQNYNVKSSNPKEAAREIDEHSRKLFEELSYETQ